MTAPDLPAPENDDQLDWNVDKFGHMSDYATDDEPETIALITPEA